MAAELDSLVAQQTPEPIPPGIQQGIEAIRDGAFERERDDVAPFDAIEIVRTARLGALRVPGRLGGGDASLRTVFSVLIGLAEADPNVAHILRMHFCIVETLRTSPDEEWRARWFSEVAAGAIFGGASAELGPRATGGFDASQIQTTLTPSGDDFVLDGTKYYSTGSLYADFISVTAQLPDGTSASAMIPARREGVRLVDDWDGMGQRLTASGTSHFDQVRVAADEVRIRRARQVGGNGATFAQLYLTALIAGILRSARNDAVALLRGRQRTFSHASTDAPTDDPLLQQVIGRLASNAFAAEAAVLSAADALAAANASAVDGVADPALAEHAAIQAAQAKIAVDELAQRSGWLVFEVGGASATKRPLNLDRHWRNARTITSHNPSLYKARAIGDHLVNDAPLPASALF